MWECSLWVGGGFYLLLALTFDPSCTSTWQYTSFAMLVVDAVVLWVYKRISSIDYSEYSQTQTGASERTRYTWCCTDNPFWHLALRWIRYESAFLTEWFQETLIKCSGIGAPVRLCFAHKGRIRSSKGNSSRRVEGTSTQSTYALKLEMAHVKLCCTYLVPLVCWHCVLDSKFCKQCPTRELNLQPPATYRTHEIKLTPSGQTKV